MKSPRVERALQAFQGRGIRRAIHLREISLRLLAAGMADFMLQPAVVGHQQQAFAVRVQPPGG